MRCLTRILLNALTGLSLLLALAMVVLWVRSYGTRDQYWTTSGYFIVSEFGALYTSPNLFPVAAPIRESFPAGKLGIMERELSNDARRLRPVRLIRRAGLYPPWIVIVPHWFAALAFAALPACHLAERIRRRPPPGRCPHCGYDLRATPERCPECGKIPAA